jgi:hypothetical protein
MMNHVASTTKKFLAAAGLALGLTGFGLFADISIAAAHATAPDTGTYDDMTDLAEEGCWGGVSSPPVAWEVGDPESAGCEHSRMSGSFGPNAS